MTDLLGYKGKNVVVTGAASGMGEQTAKLLLEQGAKVYALDIKEPEYKGAEFININLADKSSIDNAIGELPDTVDSIFNVAGVAGRLGDMTHLDVAKINFIGPVHLINSLVPRIPEEGSIAFISSAASMGWQNQIDSMLSFVQQPDFDAQEKWFDDNAQPILDAYPESDADPSYLLSKEAAVLWVKQIVDDFAEQKIRLNAVSPGNTTTPMSKDFNTISKKDASAVGFMSKVGRPALPIDIAKALLFINSDMASYISGVNLFVDYGFTPAVVNQFDK